MKILFLRLLLMVMLTAITSHGLIYAPPISKEMKEIRIEAMHKYEEEKNYYASIDHYVNDVGTKYKYSYRAKDFLTADNIDMVIKHCKSYPSVVIAMAILETGWGKYAIGNNYFGIKGKGHVKRTKEWDGTKFITITSSFQYYESMAKSVEDHSRLLHGSRYNIGKAQSYQEAVKLIKLGGYATDPNYESKINFIINKYELYRLDEIKT